MATAIAHSGLAGSKEIFEQCESVLQEGVKKTIEAHFGLIGEQYARLQQQTDFFLAEPAVFNAKFTAFLDVLAARSDGAPKLAAIHGRLSALAPVTILSVQEALSGELALIEADADLTRDQREAYQLLLCNDELRAYFDANQYNLEQYLFKIQKLQETVTELSYIHKRYLPYWEQRL